MKFGHINIKTKSLKDSIAFYKENLEAQVISESQTPTFKRAMISIDGTIIELMEKSIVQELKSGVVDHLAFYVESLDQVMMTFDNNQVKRFTPEPFETLGLRIMFYLGPDGEKLEFMELLSLPIDEELKLIKASVNDYHEALKWYSNQTVLKGSENRTKPYTIDEIHNMYKYLSSKGELYFIEYKGQLIGDAALLPDSMPIVIGVDEFRGKGIGKKVLARLIERAYELGRKELLVKEIYHDNKASINLYTSFGFVKYKDTDKGCSYKLALK